MSHGLLRISFSNSHTCVSSVISSSIYCTTNTVYTVAVCKGMTGPVVLCELFLFVLLSKFDIISCVFCECILSALYISSDERLELRLQTLYTKN